jgi:hypothetical protein
MQVLYPRLVSKMTDHRGTTGKKDSSGERKLYSRRCLRDSSTIFQKRIDGVGGRGDNNCTSMSGVEEPFLK